jgi:hypothetical protein
MGEKKKGMTLMEKQVWDEFVQAKAWEQYTSEYSGHRMDWKKWFGVITGSLAVIGSSAWSFWSLLESVWVTPVMLFVLGFTQLLTASQPYIIVDGETLESLAKLRRMYISYSNKLERLLLKILDSTMMQEEIEEQYFSLRETVYPIEKLKDSLNIPQLKRLKKRVEDRMRKILKDKYNVNP